MDLPSGDWKEIKKEIIKDKNNCTKSLKYANVSI